MTDLALTSRRALPAATGGSDYYGDLMTYAEAHATLDVPASVVDAVRHALG